MKEGLMQRMQRLIPLKRIPYSNYILIAILILGFVLRVYQISSLPLYGDELTIAYDSYSILKTGRDQTGEYLPLTFKMGAGRPAGYVYGSIPFISVIGLNEIGVRGLSVFSGLGIIILMYFLGKKLFDEKVGLLTSFFSAISLWDIYLSRGGFEAHFALFLTLFGVVMFLYGKYIPMAILWGVAIFTYPTFKLTLPILFLVLIIFNGIKNTIKNRIFIASVLILAVFAGFNLKETFKGNSEERFLRINIFSDTAVTQNIIQRINEQRNLSTLPESIKTLLYNKPIWYSRILLENYIENLSPSFLYLRGDGNPRHNPGEWGMLYLVDLPLLLVGLYFLAKEEKRKLILLVIWVLIVPLATMLLGETHALRNNLMLPPFLLISAYSFIKSSKNMKYIFATLLAIQLIYVLLIIYYFAPNKFGSFWSLDAKTISLKAIEEANKGNKVTLLTKTDNIEYAYPVYAKIDPKEVISQYGKYPKVYGNVVISDK